MTQPADNPSMLNVPGTRIKTAGTLLQSRVPTHPNSAGPQLPQIPELHATHPNSVGPPRAPSGSRVPPIPPGAILFLLRRGPQQFLFGEIFVCSQIELTTCLSVLTESISQAMPCSFSHQSINQPKLTDVKASPASLQRPTCFQPSSRET